MKSKSKQYHKQSIKTVSELGHYFTKWTRSLVREPETIITEPSETIQGEEIHLKEFVRMHASGEIPEMAMSAFDFDPSQDEDHDLDISPRYATDIVDRNLAIQENIQNQLDLETQIIEEAAQKEKAAKESKAKKQSEQNEQNDSEQQNADLDKTKSAR